MCITERLLTAGTPTGCPAASGARCGALGARPGHAECR